VADWLAGQTGQVVDPDVDVVRSGLHRVEGRELWSLLEPRPGDSPQ
jgi:hypothetical protein